LVEDGKSLAISGGELTPVLLDHSPGQHVLGAQLHLSGTLVHLVVVVSPHITVLLLLLLDVLDEVLRGHFPRLVRHRATLIAQRSSA